MRSAAALSADTVSRDARLADGTGLELDVIAAAAGDREAFGRLVDRTKSTVSSISLALVGDPDASQDIAQEVFLAAWKGLARLRNPASFLPWLRQTARNRSRTWLRDDGRRRAATREADEELLAQAVDPRPSATDEMTRLEERLLLARALQALPAETREIVVLYYREGRSVDQVAALLEMSPDAVKQRLSRARRRLRQDVARRLEETLVATAPPAAFTAAVLSALTAGAPSAAASTALAAAAKSGGTGVAAKLAAALGGIGLGVAGGVLGVVLGLRGYFRHARDEVELRRLRRFRATAVALVLAACASFTAAGWWRSAAPAIGGYAAFMTGLWILYFLWLPRIVGRDRVSCPDGDPVRRRRMGRWRVAGFLIGMLSGLAGLLIGLQGSGLLF